MRVMIDPPLEGEVAARSADGGVSAFPAAPLLLDLRYPSTMLRMVPLPFQGRT
jgi:hypothetical protein